MYWLQCASAKATQTIPIVFMQGANPVQIGLVDSLNRPGGNLTGISLLSAETAGKRLELLLELVPKATSIGYLRNPANRVFAETETREVEIAARAHGVRLLFVNASRPSEIETAFAELVQQRPDALQVSGDGLLLTYPDQIVALAARYAVPAIYSYRQYAAVGGLISYGTNIRDAWRQAGIYTGRILKGERPADLPVQQVTNVELVINLKTAKAAQLLKSAAVVQLWIARHFRSCQRSKRQLTVCNPVIQNFWSKDPIHQQLLEPSSIRNRRAVPGMPSERRLPRNCAKTVIGSASL